jgi:hypothetical protein
LPRSNTWDSPYSFSREYVSKTCVLDRQTEAEPSPTLLTRGGVVTMNADTTAEKSDEGVPSISSMLDAFTKLYARGSSSPRITGMLPHTIIMPDSEEIYDTNTVLMPDGEIYELPFPPQGLQKQ